MIYRIPDPYRPILAGLLIGVISLSIPLLRDLHWESAAAASLSAALYAGWLVTGNDRQRRNVFVSVLGMLIGWITPLLIYTVAAGCFSIDGLAYWIFGPFPSLLFGWAAGRLIRHYGINGFRFWTIITLSGVAILPLIVQFLSFPQLYFFNHIWSFWPGPIYDELVYFDPRLIGYRSLTILWAIVFWALPSAFEQKISTLIVILGTLGIMFSYYHASGWGWIAPEVRIQQQLGAMHETDHFRIFYPDRFFDPEELKDLEELHESGLFEITEALEVDIGVYRNEKIHSYIYSGEEQKKTLTGAGQTSYVPVWLKQDQTHINAGHLERVLKHELVHIVAKQFGNRFGASRSIGLIEGVAVALDPDRYPSHIDQLVAARNEWPGSDDIEALFRFTGFYGTAGPISYVISGSFVRHLLEEYPVESFKEAYRTGDIAQAYQPHTIDDLVNSWHRYLATVPVETADRRRSMTLFSTASIFQIPCPRVEKQREMQVMVGLMASRGGENPQCGL